MHLGLRSAQAEESGAFLSNKDDLSLPAPTLFWKHLIPTSSIKLKSSLPPTPNCKHKHNWSLKHSLPVTLPKALFKDALWGSLKGGRNSGAPFPLN